MGIQPRFGRRKFQPRAANQSVYLRFTGNVQLERFVNGELVEDVSDPGIWEMMYLGHVYR